MKKKWLLGVFWFSLLLVLTFGIRQLANYQQQSHLTQMKVAPAVLQHMDSLVVPETPQHQADDWRGKTGLPSTVEVQFMDFLHLKFGESKDDPAALEPEDLVYLGAFEQDEGAVRYWLLPAGYGDLYGTVALVDGSTPVFGVASSHQLIRRPFRRHRGTKASPWSRIWRAMRKKTRWILFPRANECLDSE